MAFRKVADDRPICILCLQNRPAEPKVETRLTALARTALEFKVSAIPPTAPICQREGQVFAVLPAGLAGRSPALDQRRRQAALDVDQGPSETASRNLDG